MRATLALLLTYLCVNAGVLTVTWNPSLSTNAAGYYLYGSTNSASFAKPIFKFDCGTNCAAVIEGSNTNIFLAVTAYGSTTNVAESDRSNILPVMFMGAGPTNLAVMVVDYISVIGTTNWQPIGSFRLRISPP